MRNKIESLPKNLMENVLVKSLEGKKNTHDEPSQMNVLQLSEMTNQQSNYLYFIMFLEIKKLIISDISSEFFNLQLSITLSLLTTYAYRKCCI